MIIFVLIWIIVVYGSRKEKKEKIRKDKKKLALNTRASISTILHSYNTFAAISASSLRSPFSSLI